MSCASYLGRKGDTYAGYGHRRANTIIDGSLTDDEPQPQLNNLSSKLGQRQEVSSNRRVVPNTVEPAVLPGQHAFSGGSNKRKLDANLSDPPANPVADPPDSHIFRDEPAHTRQPFTHESLEDSPRRAYILPRTSGSPSGVETVGRRLPISGCIGHCPRNSYY